MHEQEPILLFGAGGTLGQRFLADCEARALACRTVSHRDLDLTSDRELDAMIAAMRPWAVLNASGYVAVDQAEIDAEACRRGNAEIPGALARACRRAGIPLVNFSSDLVFDGEDPDGYAEHHAPRPISMYGRCKAEGESRVLSVHPDALVVRTSAFFGHDPHNVIAQAIRHSAQQQPYRVAHDVTVSPTYVPDLTRECLDLLIDGATGLWHLVNAGQVTWADFVVDGLRKAGWSEDWVEAVPASAMEWRAARPRHSALISTRGTLLPPLEDALQRWAGAVQDEWETVGTASHS